MKTPEEYVEKLDCIFYEEYSDSTGVAYDKYEVLEAIKQVQIDAYNEAIDDASIVGMRFNDFYESPKSGDAIKQSILKLKK